MESITPQVVFYIFNIPIRDTIVYTWVMMLIVVFIAIIIGRRQPVALEMLVDFLTDTISDIMERPAALYLPMLGSLIIFIAAANIISILPFVNSPTSDINTPLALSLVVFFSVHYFGIRSKGVIKYLSEFASPIILLPFEIIGQLSRTLSLTLRLFGNIFSGAMIVATLVALVPLFAPLPLVGFGIFIGLLQAYIFTVLAAVYISAGLEASEPKL